MIYEYPLPGIGKVEMVKHRRAKHIRITIRPDATVRLTIPYGISYKKGIAFLEKKQDWIKKTLRKMEEKHPRRKWIFPGVNRLTPSHSIHLYSIPGERPVGKINGQMIEIGIPGTRSPEDEEIHRFIQSLIIRTLKMEANLYLPDKLACLAVQHGFRYGRVTMRNMKSRWGSCSSSNNISLNIQMMQLPEYLRDYILLHELVHTRIKNHGPEFWMALNQITDNQAKSLQKELRNYSSLNN